MNQTRSLLIAAALTVSVATAAMAQTAAGTSGQMEMQPQAAPGVTPAPQALTAPGSVDPFVQKREADARANADYRATKQDARQQYKAQVGDAKVNRKADKQAATNELNGAVPTVPANAGEQP
jgi:hypothetical protein